MRRGLRETIRRTSDYERDPDWDITEVLDPKRKNGKHHGVKVREVEEDDEIFFDATKEE